MIKDQINLHLEFHEHHTALLQSFYHWLLILLFLVPWVSWHQEALIILVLSELLKFAMIVSLPDFSVSRTEIQSIKPHFLPLYIISNNTASFWDIRGEIINFTCKLILIV